VHTEDPHLTNLSFVGFFFILIGLFWTLITVPAFKYDKFWTEGRRDGGTEGWRDGGMEGRRDGGTEGWRDGGTEGRKEGKRDGVIRGRDEQGGREVYEREGRKGGRSTTFLPFFRFRYVKFNSIGLILIYIIFIVISALFLFKVIGTEWVLWTL
jgi:hypothetical protein